MSTEKLSTGCDLSTTSLKKREGEKRKSPCTPLREKGKGKEGKPGAKNTCLFARESAYVRGALLRRHVNAAVEDALRIFNGTRGGKYSDENLWANFAWTFGFGTLNDLVSQARSEMELHKPPVAPSERPKILQGILSAHWRARFPNGRPGKSRGAKKGSRS